LHWVRFLCFFFIFSSTQVLKIQGNFLINWKIFEGSVWRNSFLLCKEMFKYSNMEKYFILFDSALYPLKISFSFSELHCAVNQNLSNNWSIFYRWISYLTSLSKRKNLYPIQVQSHECGNNVKISKPSFIS